MKRFFGLSPQTEREKPDKAKIPIAGNAARPIYTFSKLTATRQQL
jgi:hypothetical protein